MLARMLSASNTTVTASTAGPGTQDLEIGWTERGGGAETFPAPQERG